MAINKEKMLQAKVRELEKQVKLLLAQQKDGNTTMEFQLGREDKIIAIPLRELFVEIQADTLEKTDPKNPAAALAKDVMTMSGVGWKAAVKTCEDLGYIVNGPLTNEAGKELRRKAVVHSVRCAIVSGFFSVEGKPKMTWAKAWQIDTSEWFWAKSSSAPPLLFGTLEKTGFDRMDAHAIHKMFGGLGRCVLYTAMDEDDTDEFRRAFEKNVEDMKTDKLDVAYTKEGTVVKLPADIF